ncbi:MAG: hypothetical protein KGZ64_06260 [Thermaerobacter sp.]|nr:hypothetical protein [Thermaerobacter sp.]
MVWQKITAVTLLFTILSSGVSALSSGEQRYDQFVAALQRASSGEFVFSENEALTLLNEGMDELFADTKHVTAAARSVRIRGSTVTVVTDLRVLNLSVSPEVTFAASVAGENVVLDIKRLRLGRLPLSVSALLTTMRAAGLGEYIHVEPRLGRIVVEKRGAVQRVRAISVRSGSIRVRVGGK